MIQIIYYILCLAGIAGMVCYGVIDIICRSRCSNSQNNDYHKPNDSPDEQDFKSRYVEPIFKFIESQKKTNKQSLNICITGKWGVGKSFLMRQLKSKLKQNKNNIIVEIEPIIEGKFEVRDLMLIFYKKLKHKLSNTILNWIYRYKKYMFIFLVLIGGVLYALFKFFPDIKTYLINIGTVGVAILSFLSLCFFVIKFLSNSPILEIIKLLNKKSSDGELVELNFELQKIIFKKRKNIYVFIDEIERLQAQQLLNCFLAFRVFEDLNVTVFISIDYLKAIQQIMIEKSWNYEITANYLDKFFQIRYEISTYKAEITKLSAKFLKENFDFSDESFLQDIGNEMANYLETMRMLEKWKLTLLQFQSLLAHNHTLKYFKETVFFLAATVKHPILLPLIQKYYENNITSMLEPSKFPPLQKFLEQYNFLKNSTEPMTENTHQFDENSLKFIANLYDEKDRNKIFIIKTILYSVVETDLLDVIDSFLQGNVKNVLDICAKNNSAASEVVQYMVNLPGDMPNRNESVDPEQLNNVYEEWAWSSFPMLPLWYGHLISWFIDGDFEKLYRDLSLGISEQYLINILSAHEILNTNSSYNLEEYKEKNLTRPFINKIIQPKTKDKIIYLLTKWVEFIDELLQKESEKIFLSRFSISVLYRYIQFSECLGKAFIGSEKITNLLISFLESFPPEKTDNILLMIFYDIAGSLSFGRENSLDKIFMPTPHLLRLLETALQNPNYKEYQNTVSAYLSKKLEESNKN